MKTFLKWIISVGITLAMLYIFGSQIKLDELLTIAKKAKIFYLILGFFTYFLIMFFRGVRFNILLNKKSRFSKMLSVVVVYNFFNYVMPFRVGELSYVYLFNKAKIGSFRLGLSSLIVARLLDFIILVSVLILGVIISNENFGIDALLPLLWILLFVMLMFSFILVSKTKILIHLFKKIHFNKKIKFHILDILNNFSAYKTKLLRVVFFSSLSFIFGIITTYLIIFAFGYVISLKNIILTVALGTLSGILPISGIGGFGTFESFWVAAFILIGFSLEKAILLALGLHIIQLIYVFILGIAGGIYLKKAISQH